VTVERTDLQHRVATLALSGGGAVVRLKVTFPVAYPHGALPQVSEHGVVLSPLTCVCIQFGLTAVNELADAATLHRLHQELQKAAQNFVSR